MERGSAEVRRSLDRSRVRRRVLVMLSSLGEAYPRQLARAARVDATRLRAALEGRPPDYGDRLSLIGLGLAETVQGVMGRKYVITSKGRRHARRLTRRWRGSSGKQLALQE